MFEIRVEEPVKGDDKNDIQCIFRRHFAKSLQDFAAYEETLERAHQERVRRLRAMNTIENAVTGSSPRSLEAAEQRLVERYAAARKLTANTFDTWLGDIIAQANPVLMPTRVHIVYRHMRKSRNPNEKEKGKEGESEMIASNDDGDGKDGGGGGGGGGEREGKEEAVRDTCTYTEGQCFSFPMIIGPQTLPEQVIDAFVTHMQRGDGEDAIVAMERGDTHTYTYTYYTMFHTYVEY